MRNLFVLCACVCISNIVLAADELGFAAVDIYLDTPEPVAAWQFEFSDKYGKMQIVGVENGESDAFERAPFYDREAVRLGQADRIVVADYSLAEIAELPYGRTRIATIHLMIAGSDEDDIEVTLITAATHDGGVIDATISAVLRTGSTL